MPQILTEHYHEIGVRRKEIIFGRAAVAEGMVAWSEANEQGATLQKKTQWGLTLQMVANGSEPKVVLMVNPRKLQEFLGRVGPCTALCIMEYGVTLTGPHNTDETEAVRGPEMLASIHIGQDDYQVNLFGFNPEDENPDEDLVLGAITLSEQGFLFFSTDELAAALSAETKEEVQAEDEVWEEDFAICAGDGPSACWAG
jgi:tellurite resistance-related uncharacterized protein